MDKMSRVFGRKHDSTPCPGDRGITKMAGEKLGEDMSGTLIFNGGDGMFSRMGRLA